MTDRPDSPLGGTTPVDDLHEICVSEARFALAAETRQPSELPDEWYRGTAGTCSVSSQPEHMADSEGRAA